MIIRRSSHNPILTPNTKMFWEAHSVFNPCPIKKNKDIIKESIKLANEYGTDFQFRHDTVNPYLGEALSMPTLSTMLNKFFAGQVTAEEALKNVADTWRKRFGIK